MGGLFGLASRFARGRIFAQTDAEEIEAPAFSSDQRVDLCGCSPEE